MSTFRRFDVSTFIIPRMVRSGVRLRQVFAIFVVLTAVMGVLPSGWLLPWTHDVNRLINIAVTPSSDLLSHVSEWLRPPLDLYEDLPPGAAELLRASEEQSATYERLYLAAQQRITELEDQVRQLQLFPPELQNVDVFPLHARITGRQPGQPHGAVDLKAGSRQQVSIDSIAVHNGRFLVGRVVDVTPLASTLRPITSEATGGMVGIVRPRDENAFFELRAAPRVRLEPDGDGNFEADLGSEHVVQKGDLVLLSDPGWPQSAQMLTIGEIVSIQRKDEQPLRNRIVVHPPFQVQELAAVTLINERERSDERAGEGEAGE